MKSKLKTDKACVCPGFLEVFIIENVRRLGFVVI